MKINLKKTVLVLTALIFSTHLSQAQFFKKLKKKAADAVENTVIDKTSSKASKMTSSNMDKMFNVDLKNQADPSILPSKYNFTWKYSLKMTQKKDETLVDYFLNPNAAYFATQPKIDFGNAGSEAFMITDLGRSLMVFFMTYENTKSGQVTKNPSISSKNEATKSEGVELIKIDKKVILGYTCQGYKMLNGNEEITMYLAKDAPVSFNQIFGGMSTQNIPKGYNKNWLKNFESGIMMEMHLTHKKKKKNNISIVCIGLEEASKTIKVSDYEFAEMNGN